MPDVLVEDEIREKRLSCSHEQNPWQKIGFFLTLLGFPTANNYLERNETGDNL